MWCRTMKNRIWMLVLLLFMAFLPGKKAQAADAVLTVKEIDYEKETLTVVTSAKDTRLYYSDGKMKNWECAYGTFVNNEYVLDISWVNKTKDYTLTLKGDKSRTPVSVVLPKQTTNFKVTFDAVTERFRYTNAGEGTIYWRKADSTTWVSAGKATGAQAETLAVMKRFYAKGITLYFRVGQVKGTVVNGTLQTGSRPSKEVKLQLTKQAAAPKLTYNAVKLKIATTDKLEYSTGDSGKWTACTKNGLLLAEAAGDAFGTEGRAGRDVTVRIRTAATAKKLPSAEKTILVKAQEKAPDNAVFSYVSYSALELVLAEKKDANDQVISQAASAANPYEYTIVAAGGSLKEDAAWTAITSEKTTFTESKAPTGSCIYVRKKSVYSEKDGLRVPSLPYCYTVSDYPKQSSIVLDGAETDAVRLDEKGRVSLVKPEGDTPTGLKFIIRLADGIDTDVASINCGGTALGYSAERNGRNIVVEINSTEKFEKAVTGRDNAYPLKIKLKNGEELADGVTLTVLSGSRVVKSTVLEVYHSNSDTTEYRFGIMPAKTIQRDENRDYVAVTILAVKLLDRALDFSAEVQQDGSVMVTVSSDSLQKSFAAGDIELNKEYNLTIAMSDGKQIESGISAKFAEAGEIVGAPYIFTKSVSANYTSNLSFVVNTKKTGLYITAITWNGADIKGNCASGDRKISVELDCAKINALSLAEGLTEQKGSVVLVLNDGTVIERGCTLILQQ